MSDHLSYEEREAVKQDIFRSLHCALPGTVVSFDAETQTAEIQPAVRLGTVRLPVLPDVPVFMPVPFEVHEGDPCLVIFSDVAIDDWLESGEDAAWDSPRRHSIADGFAFVGFKIGGGDAE